MYERQECKATVLKRIVMTAGLPKEKVKIHMLLSESSIEIYKSIIQYNPDAIFILSVDGKFIEVNQVVTKIFGYSQEEVQGIHYQDIIVPEYLEVTNQYFTQALKGLPSEYETQVFQKDGDILHLEIKNIPLMVSGEIVGIFGVAKDMTELHKTKTSLSEMEEKFHSLFHSTGDAVDILDLEGNVLDVNPAFEEIYGWKREEVIGKPLPIIPTYRLAQLNDMVAHIKLGKHINGLETICMKKDGTPIKVSVTFSPIRDAKGNVIGASGITRDITKQKYLETSVKESEERYRRLVELSPAPIIVYQQGRIQYANPACIKLIGASSLEELMDQSIMDYVHPDSVQLIENRINQNQIERTGVVVPPIEEKLIRLDGTVIDIEVTGISMNHQGKPAFLMIYHDITRRKRAEEALRQGEEKYRLIAENMTDLVWVITENGVFKYASPSHVTVLGFPSEAYEGNRVGDWIHRGDLLKVRHQLADMVKTKESRVFEFRFKDVKGNWIWLEGKGTPVFDEEGHFKHFLVVSREIMERRMYEEKLSHMAYHDTLTGLPNRRLFKERLKQALKEAERYGRKMAIMYMDIDKFKHTNDTLGHDAGDELLKQFSQRVQGCLRECDTLARIGGDEFTILLPDIHEEQDALQITERISALLQEPWQIGEHIFQTTSSIGITFYPTDGTTRHELMKYADIALYEAKENGRNNFKTYSSIL